MGPFLGIHLFPTSISMASEAETAGWARAGGAGGMEGGLHVLFAAAIFVPPFPCQNRTSDEYSNGSQNP